MRTKFRTIAAIVLLLFSHSVWASKPTSDRSKEACVRILQKGKFQRPNPLAASSLISMGTLLKSRQSPFLAVMWRLGDAYTKEFPSAGLTHMFHTADVAAQEIITHMGIKAVNPRYDFRDPISAHSATMELIFSKNPPEYIRNAVIVRDGVVVVIPILKRTAKHASKTQKPSYIPIITKGHQALSQDDQLTAAFASWALEYWLGAMPKEAWIYLRPMVEVRNRRNSRVQLDKRSMFSVDPKSYVPNILSIYENFMKVASNEDGKLETVEPYRNGAVQDSPWAAHIKGLLEELDHPSMIPVPPTIKQVETLAALGFDSLENLATLDINSKMFFRVALTAEIDPVTLRRFVGRAIAKTKDTVLVSEPYENPYEALRAERIVHIDFEDVLVHGIKSGVYIFGVLIQAPLSALSSAEKELISKEISDQKEAQNKKIKDPAAPITERDTTVKTKTEVRRKKFIVAETLTQAGVDEAWARFLRFLKSYRLLKGKELVITTYSKHENVKFEQEFDILKDNAKKFTPQQKASEYYSELEFPSATGEEGYKLGRLIRNKVFFKNYPDVKPSDVFAVMDHTYDLLDPIRKNLVFPTYTNSIKKVLDYAGTEKDQVIYPPGSNGLESMAWAFQYYQTREASVMDKALTYNGMDIDGNRLMSDLIIEHAGEAQTPSLSWRKKSREWLPEVSDAVKTKRFVSQLLEKRELLETIMNRSLDSLSATDLDTLALYLDRRQYLKERKEAQEKALQGSDDTVKAEKQVLKFEMSSTRQEQLIAFFTKVNPALKKEQFSPAIEALGTLLTKPAQYLTPKHLSLLYVLDQVEAAYKRLRIKVKPSNEPIIDELVLPEALQAKLQSENPFENMEFLESETFPKPTSGDLQKLWMGLFYRDVFSSPKTGE